MVMNPETNKFEMLQLKEIKEELEGKTVQTPVGLVRPDGSPVPKHWAVFKIDENIVIKNYTFKVAYISESTLLLEPVGIPIIGKEASDE